MGGYGSGRTGGRPTVESARTLRIGQLIPAAYRRPGGRLRAIITWTDPYSGEQSAPIAFEANLNSDDGWIRLRYRVTDHWSGDERDAVELIRLTTTRPHLGGIQWWFICPVLGQRVGCLYLPDGGDQFASRAAYRLAHASQRKAEWARTMQRIRKIRRRLGGGDDIAGPIPKKPPRMHWATYTRLVERCRAAERVLGAQVNRLLGLRQPAHHASQI
jgi:hypothetical protein